MPFFFQKENAHGVNYITGPAHVSLQITFVQDHVLEPFIIALRPVSNSQHEIDPAKLMKAVLNAAVEINHALGSSWNPSIIYYLPDDTPHYELYSHCTKLLVQRLHSGEAFVQLPSD